MGSGSRRRVAVLAMLAGVAMAPAAATAQHRFATLGTGGVTGVYYAVARSAG